jgi:hypothetical protein
MTIFLMNLHRFEIREQLMNATWQFKLIADTLPSMTNDYDALRESKLADGHP